MSEEIRKDEDEVEGHGHTFPVWNENQEPRDEADSDDDEVEAHRGPHTHNRPGVHN